MLAGFIMVFAVVVWLFVVPHPKFVGLDDLNTVAAGDSVGHGLRWSVGDVTRQTSIGLSLLWSGLIHALQPIIFIFFSKECMV